MASLFGRAPKDSYQELLKLDNTGAGLDTTLRSVQDGSATNTPLQLSTTQIALNGALWPTTTGQIGQSLIVGSANQLQWSNGSGITYAGVWNAQTNTPTLTSGTGTLGAMYKVNVGSPIGEQIAYTVGSFFAPYNANVVDILTTLPATAFPVGTPLYGAGIAPGTTVVSAQALTVTSTTTQYVHITLSQALSSAVNGGEIIYLGVPLDGIYQFNVGDLVLFDGTTWDKIDGIANEVLSFNSRTGSIVLTSDDVANALTYAPISPTTLALYAPLASPALTGSPTAPTATTSDRSTKLATTAFVGSAITANTVATFNSRNGAVTLNGSDVNSALGYVPTSPATLTSTLTTYAPLSSPAFINVPTAPTATAGDVSTQIATTSFVATAITNNNASYGVATFNGRSGTVTLSGTDLTNAGGALLASPTFTGVPSAPTAGAGTNTTQVATTAFVHGLLASPAFSGVPSVPTATTGTNTTQIASTAFVNSAIAANAVVTFNTRSGAVTLTSSDVTTALGYTPSSASNVAPLASPAFTGVPTAPTPSQSDNSTTLATTQFVQTLVGTAVGGVTSFNTRTGVVTLTSGDVTTALAYTPVNPASAALTGSPTAPTQTTTDNTTKIATTAFVKSAITSGAVASFNSRIGAVTLAASDVTGVGGALLASPTFTGTPTAPTPALTDNSTTLATTAYVKGITATFTSGIAYVGTWNAATNTPALTSGTGVQGYMYKVATAGTTTLDGVSSWSVGDMVLFDGTVWDKIDGQATQVLSFNSRTGAISLTAADISTALTYTPAPIASPTFTGVPAAPTAAAATNNTQIATTAYVTTAVTTAKTALAPLASPALTGTPTAPTQATSDNSTAIATTAYVNSAIVANAPQGTNTLQSISSYFPGNISAFNGALRYYPRQTISLQAVTLFVNTAPTTSIVVDVLKNGVSIFSGTKPTIVSGNNVSTAVTVSTTLTSSDYLTINIISGNGADMTARIDYH